MKTWLDGSEFRSVQNTGHIQIAQWNQFAAPEGTGLRLKNIAIYTSQPKPKSLSLCLSCSNRTFALAVWIDFRIWARSLSVSTCSASANIYRRISLLGIGAFLLQALATFCLSRWLEESRECPIWLRFESICLPAENLINAVTLASV